MSNSTKVLLVMILLVAIFGAYYMFPYKSMTTQENTLKQEITSLQTEYDTLIQELSRKDEYIAATEEAYIELDRVATVLPQNLPQENTIALVHDIETTIGTPIASFVMTDEEIIASYEDVADSNLSEYAIKSTFNTQVTCTYDQLKDLLSYVNNNPYRMVLSDLTLSSTTSTGELQVALNLNSYGLRLGNRESIEASLGDYDYGKNSVFEPFEEYSLAFEVSDAFATSEEDVADFFILLDPIQSDRTTTTIGRTGDPTHETYILDDNENISEGQIYFYQEDDFYYYRYKVTDQTYPADYTQGYMFDPGEELEIQIFSSARIDSSDVSGLNLNIINETDMVVNIVYYSEDFDDPRLEYTSQGAVEVH